MFKPYSPELKGDLLEYLKERKSGSADNLFYGPKYFSEIKDKGIMVPEFSCVRVNQSPAPDIVYFVNSNFLLESHGYGESNMSAMGAKKGIYKPEDVLKDFHWSISHLNLHK